MSELQSTKLSRRWLLKISIFLIGLPAMGLWGLYDATIVYPRRGEQVAGFRLTEFLQQAAATGQLYRAGIENPEEELRDLRSQVQPRDFQSAKRAFLESLEVMWRLDTETLDLHLGGAGAQGSAEHQHWDISEGKAYTLSESGERRGVDVNDTLRALQTKWQSTAPPAALDGFDMAFQWLIAALGFGFWVWPIALLVGAMRRVYRWDAAARTLHMPDGTAFAPSDVEEFDKTKWHKFFVTVRLKDGKSHTMDLLKFEPLEEWILEMERVRFPEEAGASVGQAEAAAGSAASDGGMQSGGGDAQEEPGAGADDAAEAEDARRETNGG